VNFIYVLYFLIISSIVLYFLIISSINRFQRETLQESGISKEIASLKCEIITRLNPVSSGILDELDRNSVKKTHSFAGSDISKTSLTSSENTDASIVTTTTEGTPSLLSTEGFCEGESTDVSPGSTLNKCSSRYTPTTVTDSENETTMILDEDEKNITEEGGMTVVSTKRRTKDQKGSDVVIGIVRSESKDDGMDCNFASEDEEQQTNTRINNQEGDKEEPIYINACNEVNERNLQQIEQSRTKDDYSNNNNMYVASVFSSPEFSLDIQLQNIFLFHYILYFLKTVLPISFSQRGEDRDA